MSCKVKISNISLIAFLFTLLIPSNSLAIDEIDFEEKVYTSGQLSRVIGSICTHKRFTRGHQREILHSLREAAMLYDINETLLLAVLHSESRCKIKARSRAGARGLMQLMPQTAKWLGVKKIYSVRENILGGAKYLSYLRKKFKGNITYAIAAYNAGPTNVRRYGGIPPYRETKTYVRRVIGLYNRINSGRVEA